MRLFPSFLTLATALDAEEAAWVARWRRPPQSKKHHWHRLAGPIDVSCTFRYRLGLTKDAVGAAGPALALRFDPHQRWLSEPHAPESAAFAATPRLCASAANQEALEGAPAHVMVTSSLAYLFRRWPYFANHVRFAKRRRRRFFVWIGELPEGLATTIGGACRRSAQGHVLLDQGMLPRDLQRRVLKSIYFQRESAQTIYTSTHYNNLPAVRERRPSTAGDPGATPRRGPRRRSPRWTPRASAASQSAAIAVRRTGITPPSGMVKGAWWMATSAPSR